LTLTATHYWNLEAHPHIQIRFTVYFDVQTVQ
jgi:hypothetical protein